MGHLHAAVVAGAAADVEVMMEEETSECHCALLRHIIMLRDIDEDFGSVTTSTCLDNETWSRHHCVATTMSFHI